MAREAGILMPITSLPSPYGIGTLGKEAREFADFLIYGDHLHQKVNIPLTQFLHQQKNVA